MPLTKRLVSPTEVSRHRLPPHIRSNELECVSNGTLANLMRQLSSLSHHAENIFGELYLEAVKLEHKTNTLTGRVDRLARKVTQLDSSVEEVSLQDLHLRKAFKSNSLIDQQSLSRQTLPNAMGECYSRCDAPPNLDKLNPYRDDGKSGLKFYTDPEYFFDLWRREMLKEVEQNKKVKQPKQQRTPGDGAKKKRQRQPVDHRTKYWEEAMKNDVINLPPEYQAPEHLRQQAATRYSVQQQAPAGMVRPEHLEGLQPSLNGQPSSGYGSGAESAASHYQHSNGPTTPRVSIQDNSMHNANLARYNTSSSASVPTPAAQAQYAQYGQQHTVANSQYMAAGYVNTYLHGEGTPTAQSPASSEGSRYRPSMPPPAPPPAGQQTPSPSPAHHPHYSHHVNGDLSQRVRELSMEPMESGPRTPTGRPSATPPLPPGMTSSQPDNGRLSPDLPPPPPPLDPSQLDLMGRSTTSMMTEKLPSPPPLRNEEKTQGAPPPPPPPPPMPAVHNGQNGDVHARSQSPRNTADRGAAAGHLKSPSRAMDARSDLLKAIRDGINLKKVDRQEQKAREREAAQGHDVAAILRKRMEDVMGASDSDESEADDWDADWDDD